MYLTFLVFTSTFCHIAMFVIIIIAQIARTPSEVQSAKVETISHIVGSASTAVHCAVCSTTRIDQPRDALKIVPDIASDGVTSRQSSQLDKVWP